MKTKLYLVTFALAIILAFNSCENNQIEKKQTTEINQVINSYQSSLNLVYQKFSKFIKGKTKKEITEIKKNINQNNQNFILKIFEEANITKEELITLFNNIDNFQSSLNFEELTEQQQKEIFKLESRKIQTRATQDCTEFETQARENKRAYYRNVAFCCIGAAVCGGNVLAGAVCIAAANMDFSEEMGRLERQYPDCIR